MKLRNINPVGQVDLPLIGRMGHPDDKITEDDAGDEAQLEGTDRHGFGCLEPDEVFDVTEDQARALLRQEANYAPADDEAKTLAEELVRIDGATDDDLDQLKVTELRQLAADRGLDTTGRKADLIDRLRASTEA